MQFLAGLSEAKSKNHKYEYGALMLQLKFDNWDNVLSSIDKEDLYDEEPGFGLEHEPHTTVLFGFHKNADIDKIKELVKVNCDDNITVKIKNISHFETEKYDVVKYDVESKTLNKLNSLMTKNFDYTNDYPEYHPHVTIAYVKKGKGKKYDKKIENEKVESNTFKYSSPDGSKTHFKI